MTTKFFIAAACGASLQELLYWYDLRQHLKHKRYERLLRSTAYWIVTGLMIALSTVGTWLWFDGATVDARHYLLVGAAFPLLFKSAVPAVAARRVVLGDGADPKSAGAESEKGSVLKDYFQVGESR